MVYNLYFKKDSASVNYISRVALKKKTVKWALGNLITFQFQLPVNWLGNWHHLL